MYGKPHENGLLWLTAVAKLSCVKYRLNRKSSPSRHPPQSPQSHGCPPGSNRNSLLSFHRCHQLFIIANLIMKWKRLVHHAVFWGAGGTGYTLSSPDRPELLLRLCDKYTALNTWYTFCLSGHPLNSATLRHGSECELDVVKTSL